jgi:hypothetical protein
MAFDDKTQPNQGNDQPKKGGLDRTNPNTPAGATPVQGQTEGNAAGNKPEDQELDEQGEATGQMSNQKESNRMVGTS